MKKIFPLPEQLIAKIAAGEVIERPSYAVKELIENSLDAGADTITIQIEDSGLQKIMVTDNGEGMSLEDLHEAYKPHTTSKISTEEQLSQISTLGFRGEALSSIASISSVTLNSRTQHTSSGTSIHIQDGQIIETIPVGMAQGTSVIVEQLFASVPARKKFLKSKQTEYRHILEVVVSSALAYPDVRFEFVHNKKTIFSLPQQTIVERITLLLGTKVSQSLLPIEHTGNYIQASGFISSPQGTNETTKQFFFINQRKINNKLIAQAIRDAYGTLLGNKNFPTTLLFLDLPTQLVDVNVHPRKEEVRFTDNQLLYDTVYRAVGESLSKHNLLFHETKINGLSLADKHFAPVTESFAGRILKENQVPWALFTRDTIIPFSDIMQVHNLYLLTPTKDGVLFVDQHAAHERILYEQLLEEFAKKKKEQPQFHFTTSVVLEFTLADAALLLEYLEIIKQLGFSIEPFAERTFLLRSMPYLLQDRDPHQLITEILADVKSDKKPKEIDTVSRRMIAYLACRGSVKAGDKLTKKQAKDLLEKLEAAKNNATCPHGRPTKVEIELQKLHTMFKRK